jgi:hypothetical protein
MFALMIGMAARRAIRNPERYGRREGNENEAGQTRAGGIAQALLDTFPVIKFNRTHTPKSLHSETDFEFRQLPHTTRDQYDRTRQSGSTHHGLRSGGVGDAVDDHNRHSTMATEKASMSYLSTSALGRDDDDLSVKSVERPRAGSTGYTDSELHLPGARDPSAAMAELPGDMEEQCPICLIEFEEGDDIRVLPCEKEHVYHKTCIDPWLLDVSSSCPLCRKGTLRISNVPLVYADLRL